MTEQQGNDDLSASAAEGHGAACGASGEQRLAAEGEVAVALLSMDGGDLPHAASHLGFALAADPQLPEAHEALARLAARCGGADAALELFPMERPYIGAVACRANLCAAAGRWDEAVGLLASVIGTEPSLPWAHAVWLTRPDLPDLLSPEETTQAIVRVLSGGLPGRLPADLRAPMLPFYELIQATVARHPHVVLLSVMASGLARRFDDADNAIAWAEKAQQIEPGHLPSLMLGYALREADRPAEALQVWEQELRRDPSDLSLHVDVAELYAAIGRPAEGLPWVERALAVDPDHPQAAPAIHGVRYALDGNSAHLVALADHLREHPEHEYAATVLAEHCKGKPWLGTVHSATEATMNALHQALESGTTKSDHAIQLAVSALEPPSALLTFQLVFPQTEAVYQSVGEPDPRLPLREVGVRVWQFDGMTAAPAVAPPSAEAAELLREVARLSWPHPIAAYDHAIRLSSLSLADLLGVMAHPPLPRDDEQGTYLAGHLPDLWVRAVQTFACLGITHHLTDQPWAESERRRVLYDLLAGPEDWVSEAAAMALVTTAWVDPSTRNEIGVRIADRMFDGAKAYRTRVVTILASLCTLTRACPWLREDVLSAARVMLERIKADEEQQPQAPQEQSQDESDAVHVAAPSTPQPASPPPPAPPRRGLFGLKGRKQ